MTELLDSEIDIDRREGNDSNFLRRHRVALPIGLVSLGLVLTAPLTIPSFDAYTGLLRAATNNQPSSQEKFIEDTLQATVLKNTQIMLTCSDIEGSEQLGMSFWGYGIPNVTTLNQKHVCAPLNEYVHQADKSTVSFEQVQAIRAVTHEGEHIRFYDHDEAATDCRSFQDFPEVAMRLGATRKQANEAQKEYAVIYFATPASYTSPDCRDGGKYDLDPNHVGFFPFPHDPVVKYGNLSINTNGPRPWTLLTTITIPAPAPAPNSSNMIQK